MEVVRRQRAVEAHGALDAWPLALGVSAGPASPGLRDHAARPTLTSPSNAIGVDYRWFCRDRPFARGRSLAPPTIR